MKQSLQQIAEANWPEDEAFACYMDFCLGWRQNPDMEEYDYKLRRQLDIDYYRTHVFDRESDCEELVSRFIAAYDKTDSEYADAEPESN